MQLINVWITLSFLLIVSSILDGINRIYDSYPIAKDRPIKVFIQVIKIFFYCAAIIIIISILLDKDPFALLAGLGAIYAVLMLVFKDSILGFVAGIQLISNRMVNIGDWIVMPSSNADGDVIEAKTVILADGVNSILAEKLGMAKRVKPTDVAVGVKELIELPKSVIEDRFQLQGNQGAACLFAGSPTDGLMGGGFLYTNENTLSLGLVCGLHHLHDAKKSVPQMLEDFKQHPAVAPLIAGGKLVEYSAHVVPEAGINMLPELVGDGVLIAGDAAGMCMNLGFTIRGMDLAIAAGEAAAKTVLSAMKSDDFSKQKLAEYRQHLESGPLRDMRMYQKLPAFLDNPRMFSGYPELAVGVARDLFTIDGSAPELMRKKILRHGKKVGFINLIKDGMKGVTVL